MIVSDLKHIAGQTVNTRLLGLALDFLQQIEGQSLDDGRITIEGDQVYALIQSYRTEPLPSGSSPRLEAHRQYIDIQYVVSGSETLGWAPLKQLSVTEPYDATKDVEFGSAPPAALTLVRLAAGQMAVLWPEDAHAPRLATAIGTESARPADVNKIVVKVLQGFTQ
jgi:biofilm protein TabA